MSRKLKIFGVLVSLVFLVGFTWSIDSKTALASPKQTLNSPTYIEQLAFGEFLNHLNKELPIEFEWSKPFYVQKSELPKVIRNCKKYRAVDEILANEITVAPVQQENPKTELPSVSHNDEPTQQIEKQEQQEVKKPEVKPEQIGQSQTSTPQKVIALTFDDGPHKRVTDLILDVLQKHQVKATFFVLGQNVASLPLVVQRMHEQGHEIGNHSWSHRNLTKLSVEELDKEMTDTNEQIYNVIGQYPTLYRPPFGAINDQVKEAVSMTPVLWNIDTLDWQHKTPAKTLENVKKQAKDSSILLMHDIYEESYEALDSVITYLEQQGYQFVTISELIQGS